MGMVMPVLAAMEKALVMEKEISAAIPGVRVEVLAERVVMALLEALFSREAPVMEPHTNLIDLEAQEALVVGLIGQFTHIIKVGMGAAQC